MIKRISYIILLIVLVTFSKFGLAQTDSLEVHTVNGKKYYIHIVAKGESLYYIHKTYNVPLEVIKKENPSVEDGLSIGEKIFIPLKKDIEQGLKTNGNYINHIVAKQQTLYSIAKLYQVQQNEIIAANPEIVDGLKEGQLIRIPVIKLKRNETEPSANQVNNNLTHVVKKGETLYALSKQYNTTVEAIKQVNGGLTQGLKVGEQIYIPIKQAEVNVNTKSNIAVIEEKVQKLIADTFAVTKKPVYNIGLMLPFYLDENDEMTENRKALEERTIYPKSKFAIEFYNGFIQALNNIATDTCQFKVYVYDTKGDDSTRIKSLLLKPEVKTLDLIVGPLYYSNFKMVADFALVNKVPVVSPVKQNNKLLLGNEYVFKVIPSKSTTIDKMTKLVVDSFKTENLLAVEYENAVEKPLIDLYVKSYNEQILGAVDTTIYSSIKTLKIKSNIADIVANFKRDKNNVVFVPAADQTFITNLFNFLTTTLNKREYKDFRVTLIGMEEWMNYENIDLEYFQQLNVHFDATRYVNEKDSLTKTFISNYKELNTTYPSHNTILGYDLGNYFGGNLMNNGTLFSTNSLQEFHGKSIDLNFFKTGIESGYENTNSFMMRFEDFELKKIN